MIPLNEIPQSGQLIIAVHFKGYSDYFANETRQTLLGIPERSEVREIGIDLYPLDYWLKRTIVSEKSKQDDSAEKERWSSTRATGGLYKVGFANMTPDKFRMLFDFLNKIKKTYWEDYEILIASKIEGF